MRYLFSIREIARKGLEKKLNRKKLMLIAAFILCVCVAGCGSGVSEKDNQEETTDTATTSEYIVIGFSQLGAESDWRTANTASMEDTFTTENGYKLYMENGQQKQSNQIMAIRTFIQQEVDYIVLAPVIETGWETVLQEAKDAGIPVILVDRRVDVEDESLYTCWVGSDFELEGRKMAEWLKNYAAENEIDPSEIHIVNIQGTLGASAQIGRTRGLREAVQENGWDLLSEVPGDFTQAKGKEVMESLLKKYDNINVVYCENDNEAFGAIEAIEAAGRTVGSDIKAGEIMVISFDGVNKSAMQYIMNGKITCIAECNPLQGPLVQHIIQTLEEGKIPNKLSYVSERMYAHDNTVESVTVDGTRYEVTKVTQEILDNHIY